jgi:hypothetical protein
MARAASLSSLIFAVGACATVGEVLTSTPPVFMNDAGTLVDAEATFDPDAATDSGMRDAADAAPVFVEAVACPLTVADAGTGDGDGLCTDTDTDPLNCGSCGHDCLGAVCTGGTCGTAPMVLACSQNAGMLAVDNTAVYWMNGVSPAPAGSAGHSQVLQCAIGGCSQQATTLWDALYPATWLAAAQGSVWFPIENGEAPNDPYGVDPGILSCAGNGCSGVATEVLAVTTLNNGITAFAADAAHLYWGTTAGDLSSCSMQGCAASVQPYAAAGVPEAIAVNSSSIFWITDAGGGQVWTCPLSGCGDAGPAAFTNLGDGSIDPVLLADDQNFYWVDNGTPTPASAKSGPVTSYATGAVYECPVSDCSAHTALATYPAWLGAGGLAVDGTNLYWSTADVGGYFGSIVKCPIAGGCNGGPTPVATTKEAYPPGTAGSYAATGLAVDSANVYWTDPGRRTVMTTAK